jgi:hypothetical protein
MVDLPLAGDPKLFAKDQPLLNDKNLLDHWNDEDVAFFPGSRDVVDLAVDRDVLDGDLVAEDVGLGDFLMLLEHGSNPDDAGIDGPPMDREVFFHEGENFLLHPAARVGLKLLPRIARRLPWV